MISFNGKGQTAGEKFIKKEIVIEASLDEVWTDWTTSEGITSFFAPEANIELKVGGAFEIIFLQNAEAGQRGCDDCKILSYLPEKMLSFQWMAPPHMPEVRKFKNWVVLEFESINYNRTKLSLHHYGWEEGEEWQAAYDYFDEAWTMVLKSQRKKYTPDESAVPQLQHYLYVLRLVDPELGRNPDAWTDKDNQIVGEHFNRLKDLLEEGVVMMAGRSPDPEKGFGIVLFKAASKEAAMEIMNGDPAVQQGLMDAELHDFGLALWR